MLKINFLNQEIKDAQVIEFATAVKFEELDMVLACNNDAIKSCNNKIENKNGKYSEEEIEAEKKKKEKLEEENKKILVSVEEVRPVYEKVVKVIAESGNGEFCNGEENTRNVLRVVACADNSKLYKYALISAIDNDSLFEAMEICHSIDNGNDFGANKQSKEVRDAYVKAECEIQTILKNCLSLPFASEYTETVRTKFNKTSLKLLHECYVTGFSNKFESIKDSESVKFVSVEVKKLITSKKNNKGEVTKNFKKFAETVCKIAIGQMSI